MHSEWGGGIAALLLYPDSNDSHRIGPRFCRGKLASLEALAVMPAGQARTALGCIISPAPWSGDALWKEINGDHCLCEAQMAVGCVSVSGLLGETLSWRDAQSIYHPLAPPCLGIARPRGHPQHPPTTAHLHTIVDYDSHTQLSPPHTSLPSHPQAPKYTSSSTLTPPPALLKPHACFLPRSSCTDAPHTPSLTKRRVLWGHQGQPVPARDAPTHFSPATRLCQRPAVCINAPLTI